MKRFFRKIRELYIEWRYPIGSKVIILNNKGITHWLEIGSIAEVVGYHELRALCLIGKDRDNGGDLGQTLYFHNIKPFSR